MDGEYLQPFEWSWMVLWLGFDGLRYTCKACPASWAVSRPVAQ